MKLEQASLFFSLLLVSSLGARGLRGRYGRRRDTPDDATEEVAESEDAITGRPSNFGYFVVTRHDIRKCISPLCGGFFVKRVNQATTPCADGTQAGRVLRLVDDVERHRPLGARGERAPRPVETGKALVKARMYKQKFERPRARRDQGERGLARRDGLHAGRQLLSRRRQRHSLHQGSVSVDDGVRRSTAPTITTSSR